MNAIKHELMIVVLQCAVDLTQTYNAGLTSDAIRTRMLRIADDLVLAAHAQTEHNNIGDA